MTIRVKAALAVLIGVTGAGLATNLAGQTATEGQAGRAKLMDCRPDWMWEPDATMRNKPRCKDLKKKKDTEPDVAQTGEDVAQEDGTTPPKLPGYGKYSCWAAPTSCVQSTGYWGTSSMDQQYQRYYTSHKNVCAHRVVVKACIGRVNKAPACGMGSIEPGGTWSWDMSRSNGQYRVMHAGVLEGKDDFVCPKPPGWKELGKF